MEPGQPVSNDFIAVFLNPTMLLALQVFAVFLAAIAMSLSLAHALEFPGKLRLDQQTYLAVQTIYYPGFTIGGVGEPLAALATLILMLAMRHNSKVFWCTFIAFVALLSMHAVFWLVTQPTNRFWFRNQQLSSARSTFFGVEESWRADSRTNPDWKQLRDKWEYSHVIRAVLSIIALIALVMAIAN